MGWQHEQIDRKELAVERFRWISLMSLIWLRFEPMFLMLVPGLQTLEYGLSD